MQCHGVSREEQADGRIEEKAIQDTKCSESSTAKSGGLFSGQSAGVHHKDAVKLLMSVPLRPVI